MIDITPDTDSDTQVTEGDRIEIKWQLNAQVNPADLEFTVQQGSTRRVFSGADLTETKETGGGGGIFYIYSTEYEIQSTFEQVDFRLSDPVNGVRDTAHYTAKPKVT